MCEKYILFCESLALLFGATHKTGLSQSQFIDLNILSARSQSSGVSMSCTKWRGKMTGYELAVKTPAFSKNAFLRPQ